MRLEDHVYDWDKVVIGGNLQSLLFAFSNHYPVVFVEPSPPFRFDYVGKDISLKSLGMDPSNGAVTHLQVWQRLLFLLGLSGLLPLSSNAASIRIKGDLLHISTKRTRLIKANFNKVIVFDDKQISTTPRVKKEIKEKNRVIDWINIRTGCKHKIDHLTYPDDNFIRDLIFFSSERSDNYTLKDAVAVSYLTDEELHSLDFSEAMVRFKTKHLMEEAGIKAPFITYNNDKWYRAKIKVEAAEREIFPQVKRYYEEHEKYEFRYDTIEELLKALPEPKGYLKKLVEYAYRR